MSGDPVGALAAPCGAPREQQEHRNPSRTPPFTFTLPNMIRAASIATALIASCLPVLAVAPQAQAAHKCSVFTTSDEQVAAVAPGVTRYSAQQTLGACGWRVWMHDGRLQKRYAGTDGRELRVNYNLQPDGHWTVTNGFWFSPTYGPDVVIG